MRRSYLYPDKALSPSPWKVGRSSSPLTQEELRAVRGAVRSAAVGGGWELCSIRDFDRADLGMDVGETPNTVILACKLF